MVDLTKDRNKLLELYRPGTEEFSLVDVPKLPFAMIDGEGSPDEGVDKAIKILFMAIHPIRRQARQRMGKSFVEAPVEMLYWANNMRDLFDGNKETWKWRAMITLPAWTGKEMFASAVAAACNQMDDLPKTLRMETFEEGLCAQIMHVGSPHKLPRLLERLYRHFLPEQNLEPAGPYHEIYLDDWSRTAPERRKVILRQPVAPNRHGQ